MVRIDFRLGLVLLALAVAAPASAEEQGSDWLGSVSDFVSKGLGPPRTLDDIRREEQQRVPEGLAPAEHKMAAPIPVAVPAPPVQPEAVAEPVLAAPAPVIPEVKPEPKKAEVKAKPVMPAPVAAPVAVAAPVPPPMPVPEAKPKQAVVRAPIVEPPPEPLTSRIAATATLEQAVKLGGSADIYTVRIKKPGQN